MAFKIKCDLLIIKYYWIAVSDNLIKMKHLSLSFLLFNYKSGTTYSKRKPDKISLIFKKLIILSQGAGALFKVTRLNVNTMACLDI